MSKLAQFGGLWCVCKVDAIGDDKKLQHERFDEVFFVFFYFTFFLLNVQFQYFFACPNSLSLKKKVYAEQLRFASKDDEKEEEEEEEEKNNYWFCVCVSVCTVHAYMHA